MSDAVFNEVLEISIDSTSFVQGLAELSQAYDEFLANVSSKGLDANSVLSVGSFEALRGEIGELKDSYSQFASAAITSLENVEGQFAVMSETAQAASQKAIDAAAESAKAAQGAGGAGGSGSGGGGLLAEFEGANEGWLAQFAAVTKYRILWDAANKVIQAAFEVLKSPLVALEEGSKYLSEMQDESASLQGTIASNVTFSKDLATNFQLSGQAAAAVVEEMQKLAIAMGLPLQQLQNTFKNVLESGGMNYVQDLQGAVNLTKEFALAMTMAGGQVDSTRKLLSEIPALLNGTETGTSRILKVLNLTTIEWEAIRQKALANGDLDERLADRLAPYLTVLEQANLRQSVLNESISLQATRIEAAIALPLWQAWVGVLTHVNNFLKNNGDEIVAIGSSLVSLATNFGGLLGDLLQLVTGTTNVGDAIKLVVGYLVTMIAEWRSNVEGARAFIQILGVLSDLNPADALFNTDNWKNAQTRVEEISKASFERIKGFAVDAGNQLSKLNNAGTTFTLGNANPSLLAGGTASNGIIDPKAAQKAQQEARDEFQKIQQDFRDQLDLTKKTYDTQQDEIQNKQKEGLVSAQDAAAQRLALITKEHDAIAQLVEKYQGLTDAVKLVKPGQTSRADGSYEKISIDNDASANKQTNDVNAQAREEDLKAQDQHNKALEQMEKQHGAAMLAEIKREVSEGLLLKAQGFDAEQAALKKSYEDELGTYLQEYLDAGQNAAKQQAALDKMSAATQHYTDLTINSSKQRQAIVNAEASQAEKSAAQQAVTLAQIGKAQAQALALQGQSSTAVAAADVVLAQANLKLAESDLSAAAAAQANAEQLGIKGDALDKLIQQELNAQKAVADANNALVSAQNNTGAGPLLQSIFGKGVTDLKQVFSTFDGSVQHMGSAIKDFAGIANSIIQGVKSGGALGGIGAGATAIGGAIGGPWGEAISAAGSVISMISGLFTAAAQAETKKIQKSVDDINEKYSTGQTNLTQTLTALEQTRTDAIQKLSGMKGGKQELLNLLPSLDSQIDSLKQQQTQIFKSFTDSLAVLQLQSSTLGGMLSTWQQLNAQVVTYLGAGGDAAKAAQFLSLSLQQQQQQTQDSLNQGELTAIQDAQTLNDLLLQKVNLAKQYAEQEFALRNSDAVERAASPAVNAAIAYQQQKATNDAALTALTQQITYQQQRVSIEKQVFDLASSTYDLQAQANALNLTSLKEQVQQWKDMQTVIKSIVEGANGLYTFNPSSLAPPSAVTTEPAKTPIVINGGITVTLPGVTNGKDFANELTNELRLRGRFGYGTQYTS